MKAPSRGRSTCRPEDPGDANVAAPEGGALSDACDSRTRGRLAWRACELASRAWRRACSAGSAGRTGPGVAAFGTRALSPRAQRWSGRPSTRRWASTRIRPRSSRGSPRPLSQRVGGDSCGPHQEVSVSMRRAVGEGDRHGVRPIAGVDEFRISTRRYDATDQRRVVREAGCGTSARIVGPGVDERPPLPDVPYARVVTHGGSWTRLPHLCQRLDPRVPGADEDEGQKPLGCSCGVGLGQVEPTNDVVAQGGPRRRGS